MTFDGQVLDFAFKTLDRLSSTFLTLAIGFGVVKTVIYMTKQDKNSRSNLSEKRFNTGKNILIEHDNAGRSTIASIADNSSTMIDEATFNRFSKRLQEIEKEFGAESDVHVHLRTPGGELFFAMQIAHMISNWKGRVIAHIHAYSASGGTLIALACAEIHMDHMSVLGPIDPQVPSKNSFYSATDYMQLFGIDATTIDENFDVKPFIMPIGMQASAAADSKVTENFDAVISAKMRLLGAVNTVRYYKPFVEKILRKKDLYTEEKVASIVKNLLTNRDHSSPLWRDTCKEIGLNVVFIKEHEQE